MKIIYKIKYIFIILVIIMGIFLVPNNYSKASSSPTVNSEAAILLDAKQGKVLYEKNSNKVMYPASTTKVMTAILTVEKCDLNADITVSYWAVNSVPYSYSLDIFSLVKFIQLKNC